MTSAPVARAGRIVRHPEAPWTWRWIDTNRISPVWLGLSLALLLWALRVAWIAVFEDQAAPLLQARFWREEGIAPGVLALLAGYAPVATVYSVRAQRRALERLAPILHGDESTLRDLMDRVASFDMRWLRIVGWLALAGSACVILFDPSFSPGGPSDRGAMELLGVLWINVVPAWLVARSLAHELRAACLFSRLGREHVRIDLWDLRPLAPFAHRGLHGVLLWSGGMAIAGLMYLVSSWAGPAWQTALALALVAVAMLLLPAYGVHRNIAETKQRQLDRLHEALRAGEAELLQHESPVPAEAAARVQGLMVLRDAVRSVREWPFDAPALLRFALYLAIGFGSWLGGALVERMLGVVLQ